MEDAHSSYLSLPGDASAAFFGVYDGHGGSNVAKYAGEHLHKRIVSDKAYAEGDIPAAIKNGFLGLDRDMISALKHEASGCTSVVTVLKDGVLYCGNAGDSRGVLSHRGHAVPLSYDHKPTNDAEVKRITAAGGFVEFGRVNGNLALSRALGDFEFKMNTHMRPEHQIVTADPDILIKKLVNEHEFFILACDGIWDVMSNQEVIDFCRERIAAGIELHIICEQLMDHCLAPESRIGGVGCDK